jgi:FkbM family methyltransferase
MDPLGYFLKHTPAFKGKRRLAWYWMARRDTSVRRVAILPGGCRVTCDLSVPYEAMVWLGLEEDRDLGVARRLLRPGSTFVDCGANIGLWTLTASPLVGATGRVFAFEPNPATSDRLAANVSANLLDNVTVIRAAVGARSATAPFRCESSHNNSALCEQTTTDTILVPVLTLDEFIGDQPVHAIKIDVEGYELDVLRGADRVIERPGIWLCIEFNTIASQVSRLADWKVHRHLRRLGYSAWLMSDALRAGQTRALPDGWEIGGYCNLFYSRDQTPEH